LAVYLFPTIWRSQTGCVSSKAKGKGCRREGERRLRNTLTTRADIVVTSLGGDEAVEEVYKVLFGGQEVSLISIRCFSEH
jgi:hypothetical protein